LGDKWQKVDTRDGGIFISLLLNAEILIWQIKYFSGLYTRGKILINLNREVCMRSMQKQLGTWESSQHLLKDRVKPRKRVSRFPVADPS
jgi:hypothetical protein